MALRLHPIGQGPLGPSVNIYNNSYQENVEENVWPINTTELLKHTMKDVQEGKIEANNYPLNERQSVAWSNKPVTFRSNNLSPIAFQKSPYSAPFTYNRNNNNISLGNLKTPDIELRWNTNKNSSNSIRNLKTPNTKNKNKNKQSRKYRTRRNRKTRTSRKNRKTRRN